jgi:trehalose 6-phosphate synthase/phosphatase
MAANSNNNGGEPTLRRRESLSEIRAANPDLALSGNIISATFNTPHSFVYRKGGDWVCRLILRFTFASQDIHGYSSRIN